VPDHGGIAGKLADKAKVETEDMVNDELRMRFIVAAIPAGKTERLDDWKEEPSGEFSLSQ